MKITDLEIGGFGAWSNLRLENVSQNLTLFFGPNEAGKTTLLHFIRGMLYGLNHPGHRKYLALHDVDTVGGVLTAVGAEGEFSIARRCPSGRPEDETVKLTASDGVQYGASQLHTRLSGVDESIFNNVFAVGLGELHELATLSDTDAADWLYCFTSGMDRVSLVEVMRELVRSREQILAQGDQRSQIGDLLARRDTLVGEIDAGRDSGRRWVELSGQRRRVVQQISDLDSENRELETKAQTVEAAMAVQAPLTRRGSIEQQIEQLGPVGNLTDQDAQRLDRLRAHIERCRRRYDEVLNRRRQLRADVEALDINEVLWHQTPRIEALVEQQDWIRSLKAQGEALQSEVDALAKQSQALREGLGLRGENLGKECFEISGSAMADLRRPAAAFREARQRRAAAEEQLQRSRAAAQLLQSEIAAGLAGSGTDSLAQGLETAGNQVAVLRRRVQIDERLEQMERQQRDLEERCRSLIDKQLMPVWALAALGLVFVTSVVLIFIGFWTSSTAAGIFGWLLAGVGLCAGATKFVLERSAAGGLTACREQIQLLCKQIQQAAEDRKSLDAEIPAGGGPMTARLQAAETRLASMEQWIPLQSRHQAAQQQCAAAQARSEAAAADVATAMDAWRRTMRDHGLPADLTPKQVRGLQQRASRLGELFRQREARAAELDQRRREYEGIAARVSRVWEEIGRSPTAEMPEDQIGELSVLATQQVHQMQQHRGLRQMIRRLRHTQQKWRRRVTTLRRQRAEILANAGVDDALQLEELIERHARCQKLRQQRDELSRQIGETICGRATEAQVVALLAEVPADRLDGHWEDVGSRLENNREQLKRLAAQSGQLDEQMRLLAEDRGLHERQLDLAVVQSRLDASMAAWQARCVTSILLEEIRRDFERHRQPETLIEASHYFQQFTEGQYVRVWTPLGEPVLFVDDADGRKWPLEMLSRGTREQLYLSLRLALVALYARRGATLPMVLDDVLVNFDVSRARAVARVLRDFAAEGHQLLVFTCHEHVWKIFKSLKVDVRRLPSRHAIAGTVGPLATEIPEEPARQVVESREESPMVEEDDDSQIDAEEFQDEEEAFDDEFEEEEVDDETDEYEEEYEEEEEEEEVDGYEDEEEPRDEEEEPYDEADAQEYEEEDDEYEEEEVEEEDDSALGARGWEVEFEDELEEGPDKPSEAA